MSIVRSLTLAVTCTALLPATAAAQDSTRLRFAFGGGIGYETDNTGVGSGVHLQGAFTIPLLGPRLTARIEASFHHFDGSRERSTCGGSSYAPGAVTPSPAAPGTVCVATAKQLTALATGASLVLIEQQNARGAFYWIAGVGVYTVTESPWGSYARPGWNFGFGVRFGGSGFGELRYHQTIQPQSFRRLVPITFGVRF